MGYVLLISLFSPYLPLLDCGCLSHDSILSFLNQDPHVCSVCGETAEQQGREPIITLRYTSHIFPTGICEKKQFSLEESGKRVRRQNTTRLWGSTQLGGFTQSPGQCEFKQKLGKIECVNRCMIGWDGMRWYETRWDERLIYAGVSPTYTPHWSTHLGYPCISIRLPSSRPSSLSLCLQTPADAQFSTNLSGGGGEKWIFPPQQGRNLGSEVFADDGALRPFCQFPCWAI